MITWESVGIETKGKSGRFYTVCPKCSSDRKKKNVPCLTVNDEAGNRWWKCNHATCGWSGNLETYEKFDKIRQKARLPQQFSEIYTAATMERLFVPKKISAKTALKAKVYEIPAFNGEKFNQVAFPFFYQGNLVNVKFRRLEYDISVTLPNGTERYLSKNWQLTQADGAKVCYWGLEMLDFAASQDIIITEGETDRLTWMEYDFANVLSVPNGAVGANDKNVDDKMAFARDEWVIANVYAKAKHIYIAMDDDAAGNRMKDELANVIGRSKCHVIKYGGRKDINEVSAGGITKDGKELMPLRRQGVEDCFAAAKPYPVGGILTFDMIRVKLEELSMNGIKRGYMLDSPAHDHGVNRFLSIKNPFMAVVTGLPGSGKSSWWRWYMTRQSIKNGLRWGLFVPDSRPEEREILKIAEIYAGASWERNKPWSMNDAERNRAIDFVREHFFLIRPDAKNTELLTHLGKEEISVRGLDSLMYYFDTLKRQHNIFGWVMDAWNKIEHQKPNGTTDEQFVSKQLDRILAMNVELDLFGSIIAHPTKLERRKDVSGNYDAPDLYNVKGSSAWFEKADVGITVHRQKYRRVEVGTEGLGRSTRKIYKWVRDNTFPIQIIVNKIKQQEIGEEGEIEMYMDWKHGETFVYDKPDYYGEPTEQFAQKKEEDLDDKKETPTDVSDVPF